jgi:hypothetical protein
MWKSFARVARRSLVVSGMVLSLAGAGCQDGKAGSGQPTTETRTLGDFTALELHGTYVVELELGKPTKVEVVGDDNLVPLVETTLVEGRLVVKTKEAIAPKTELVLRLSTPDVAVIEAEGAVALRVRGVSNAALRLRLAGVSGAIVEGKTGTLEAKLSGAGGIEAKGLEATRATIDISGAGHADVNATDELVVDVSGAGAVTYGGNPKSVKKTVSGVGSVTAR